MTRRAIVSKFHRSRPAVRSRPRSNTLLIRYKSSPAFTGPTWAATRAGDSEIRCMGAHRRLALAARLPAARLQLAAGDGKFRRHGASACASSGTGHGWLQGRPVRPAAPSTTWLNMKWKSSNLRHYQTALFRRRQDRRTSAAFSNRFRQANRTQIRVPIDDTHTWIVYVHFVPDSAEPRPAQGRSAGQLPQAFQKSTGARHPFTKFRLDEVDAQDFMAWETQGPILDRTRERLAAQIAVW